MCELLRGDGYRIYKCLVTNLSSTGLSHNEKSALLQLMVVAVLLAKADCCTTDGYRTV